ncbi:MAG: hypothetical protein ACOYLV_01350 [Rubrivivax sp.]|jgi:hypothetical protein
MMHKLVRLAILAAPALVVAGCSVAHGTSKPVAVYMSLGSKQCQEGGRTVSDVQKTLRAAGIQVLAATCGSDGFAYPAVCGAPDGRIAIVDVPAEQASAAVKLGFRLLSDRPGATRSSCS